MKNKEPDDIYFMRKAISLARKGMGNTSPNPMVGAVIVADKKIIGQGYHKRCGDFHAEINAINNTRKSVGGSTFYITLEPCSHFGRTPPCVDTLIKNNPKRVVVGSVDPNPRVCGKGIKILQSHGIRVDVGILESECLQLNEHYVKHITSGIPYVTVKYAQTLDGRIATKSGNSQWISSEPSRKYVHRLRRIHDSIMVGRKTITTDDPRLTVRHVKGKNPLRVIVDTRLRIPLKSFVLKDAAANQTIIATTQEASSRKVAAIEKLGAEVLIVKRDLHGGVNLRCLLRELGKRDIISVMVEGGSELITSLLGADLVDKMIIPIAPKIIGEGLEAIGNLSINTIKDAITFSSCRIMRKGGDIVFEGNVLKKTRPRG
ncbi:MAG: bifunctional diaminohydroxyphosphoribosylaminopyrimidine deaminase/5-amino-6-(5-phosphoribosylamino)uracil reductase RibD [Candidatus Scalindua sp.]|nr:bifunctional diaminohydroxyphosphoribosylaminopyrimidine deaminase/5-amino-6-(5-phosphoribosylamino)uracil reductase RibD [Candidatus Scalindua sp.]